MIIKKCAICGEERGLIELTEGICNICLAQRCSAPNVLNFLDWLIAESALFWKYAGSWFYTEREAHENMIFLQRAISHFKAKLWSEQEPHELNSMLTEYVLNDSNNREMFAWWCYESFLKGENKKYARTNK